MTFVASFLGGLGLPVIVSDVLITADEKGLNPTLAAHWHGRETPSTSGFQQVAYCSKVCIINDSVALAWAGSTEFVEDVVRNVRTILGAYDIRTALDYITTNIDAIVGDIALSVIIVAVFPSDAGLETVMIGKDHEVGTAGEINYYMAGTGTRVLGASEKSSFINHKSPLQTALAVLFRILEAELTSESFSDFRTGSFYQVLTWKDGSWRFIDIPVNFCFYVKYPDGSDEIRIQNHSKIAYDFGRAIFISFSPPQYLNGLHDSFYVGLVQRPWEAGQVDGDCKMSELLSPSDFGEFQLLVGADNILGTVTDLPVIDYSQDSLEFRNDVLKALFEEASAKLKPFATNATGKIQRS